MLIFTLFLVSNTRTLNDERRMRRINLQQGGKVRDHVLLTEAAGSRIT